MERLPSRTKRPLPGAMLCALSLLALLANPLLSPAPAGAASAPRVTFTPQPIPMGDPAIVNPLRGLYRWHNQEVVPQPGPALDAYARFTWRTLEPRKGEYDFSAIEQAIAASAVEGRAFGLRVRALVSQDGKSVPDYLADPADPDFVAGGWWNDNSGDGVDDTYVPDWNDPHFLERARALLLKLGERYDGDPRIAWVEIGMYGNWGEWHMSSFPSSGPTGAQAISDANKRAIVDMHVQAFPNTRLVMMSDDPLAAIYALGRSPQIGWRRDSLGAASFEEVQTRDAGRWAALEQRWKTAPVITELIAPGSQQDPATYQAALAQARQYHVALVGNGNLRSSLSQAALQTLQQLGKTVGYRLVLNRLSIPATIGPSFRVESEWSNLGVAPAYEPWEVLLQLRDPATGAVIWGGRSAVALTGMLPTVDQAGLDRPLSVGETFQLPDAVAPGTYELALVVCSRADPASGGCDPGAYRRPLALAIQGARPDGSYRLGELTLARPAADTLAPGPIVDLAVAGVTNSSVTLTWRAPGDDGAAGAAFGYDLRYSTGPLGADSWESAARVERGVPAPAAAGSAQSASVEGLSLNTGYHFAVRAVDGAGNLGPISNVASATTAPQPSAPAGLAAAVGYGAVRLTWNAAFGASAYSVRRATASGGPYTTIGTGVSGTRYTNTGLTNGTNYCYIVTATSAGVEGPASDEVCATPQAQPPAAPGGLFARARDRQNSVSWNSVLGATSYTLKRGASSSGPFAAVATTANNFYTDSGLTNGTAYTYVVVANNPAGASPESNRWSATPQPPPPPAAGDLRAAPGDGELRLTWAPSSGATSYTVRRATSSRGPYTTIATGLTAPAYTDAGLANGAAYYYVVVALSVGAAAPYSNEAAATPQPLPAAPAGLVATPGDSQVALAWAPVAGAVSYTLKQGPAGGPYAQVAAGLATPAYTHTGLTNGTSYCYVVSASNPAGEGPASAPVCATPQGVVITLLPLADAHVRDGSYAGQNYGTSTVLDLKSSPTAGFTRHVYMRFDLSGVTTSGDLQANLRLYVGALSSGGAVPVTVYAVEDDGWSESALTWNNRPARGAQLAVKSISATGWATFDVTRYVNAQRAGDRRVSLVLIDSSTTNRNLQLSSRESGSNRPALELRPAQPVSLTPVADAHVRDGSYAGQNYGTSTVLDLKGSSTAGFSRRVYLRFNLGSLKAATASQALLKLYVAGLPNGAPVQVRAYLVANDGWGETAITWNNKPAYGSVVAVTTISAPGWVSFDVTDALRAQAGGDALVSLVLVDAIKANRTVQLSSRESGASPVLEVIMP